ncbi:MAG: Holliday junction resolvase RuvX [Gammaproteobacteria bacterium]|nr:MAG: Holliday junction resolvase RuvX [Gammaproteobacteria bacterium]
MLVMAFDYGHRRIGVAVGQPVTGSASPIAVLPTRDGAPDWQAITALIGEWRPERLLVGVPRPADGKESELVRRVRRFCRQLEGRYRLPVATVDEHLSSWAAAERTGSRDEPLDAAAAQVILETWLNEEHP